MVLTLFNGHGAFHQSESTPGVYDSGHCDLQVVLLAYLECKAVVQSCVTTRVNLLFNELIK